MGSSRFARHKVAIGLLAAATVAGLTAVAGPASASASAGRHSHPLAGSTPRWLHRARNLGATPAANQVNFGVLLGMRNQANAEATLQAISDPTSASYGHWLSNASFDARYAPSRANVAAVRGWLRSQGFHLTTTLRSGMYVEASGFSKITLILRGAQACTISRWRLFSTNDHTMSGFVWSNIFL